MKAQDIMSTPAVAVTAGAPVSKAVQILSERGFSALPVVNHDGTLVGVVSEADVIRNRFTGPDAPDGRAAAPKGTAETVGQVMTSPPAFVDQAASLGTIADTMISGRRRIIPVVDGTKLVGVISRSDIMRFLAHRDAQVALDIRRKLQELRRSGPLVGQRHQRRRDDPRRRHRSFRPFTGGGGRPGRSRRTPRHRLHK